MRAARRPAGTRLHLRGRRARRPAPAAPLHRPATCPRPGRRYPRPGARKPSLRAFLCRTARPGPWTQEILNHRSTIMVNPRYHRSSPTRRTGHINAGQQPGDHDARSKLLLPGPELAPPQPADPARYPAPRRLPGPPRPPALTSPRPPRTRAGRPRPPRRRRAERYLTTGITAPRLDQLRPWARRFSRQLRWEREGFD